MAAILMIDDERAILELVKNGLRKDGHFVTTYTSAAQVPLDKLNRYDLIICLLYTSPSPRDTR